MTPALFQEGHLEIDGIRIRYAHAGAGRPLLHLPGAGGLRLTPGHERLARHGRVVAVELPGRGEDPALAARVAGAPDGLGLDGFDLLGTGSGAGAALGLALAAPSRVGALVLEAPTAIHADGHAADLAGRLSELAVPTLILVGTADDTGAPAVSRFCKERIPTSHLVLVYAAAHAISAERPEAFAEVVIDFLERGEAFVISRARTVIHP